ncbi:MAG: imidazolonepropionase [Saprospiraceae bacterium]|nr:imidazolonepropionase [Saprospiraceae bacterium]
MSTSIAIGPFAQIISMNGLPLKGALRDEQLEVIEHGAMILKNGRVGAVGEATAIRSKAKTEGLFWYELEKPLVAIPGLVDAHTHICFAGSRARDYAARSGGKTYLEIAQAGGGIWDTVQRTRAASEEALTASMLDRLARLLRSGVTTVEVKSGYALTVEGELKMLRAIQAAGQKSLVDVIPTCLPAHIVPRDFAGTAMEYVMYLLTEFFPIVQQEQLAKRADIFIEAEAFDLVEARHYLSTLRQAGFDLTVHADQFSTGGSQVAIDCGARSADHLEASGEMEVQALAQSEVIPVALPGASLGLGCAFTPGRRLLDAGASLAIASDWNPGSAPMGDLLTCASIFGMAEKLSLPEVLAGITFRAAAALGLQQRGRLIEGQIADITAFETTDYREIFYHQGQLRPAAVWKSGQLISEASA